MLSRVSILARQQPRFLTALNSRVTQTSSVSDCNDSDEGNQKKLPRPVRAMESGKVRLGFIPEEWFQFMYKKTGVTGPYTLGVGLSTYLFSKEIYVMEHEFYSGLSVAIMLVWVTKKLGPTFVKFIDAEIDKYEKDWSQGRETEKKMLDQAIKDEKHAQWQAEGQLQLIEAKRENVKMQLEAEYRERLMNVYREVKRRLDYQVEKQVVERRIAQKHMIDWVVAKVLSSISTEQEKQALDNCIRDLGHLAKT